MSADIARVRQRPKRALLVNPHERRDGFWANIRGKPLDLADPHSGHPLAPTPDHLFVLSVASALAWAARGFLRRHGLPDDVSISAEWQTDDCLRDLADVTLKVTVSRRAEAARDSLAAALEDALGPCAPTDTSVRLSFNGATR